MKQLRRMVSNLKEDERSKKIEGIYMYLEE